MEGIPPKIFGSALVAGSTLIAGVLLLDTSKSNQSESVYDKNQNTPDEDKYLLKCIRKMLKARVDVRLLAISNLIAPIAAASLFDISDKRKLDDASQLKEKLLNHKKIT